MNTRLPRSIYFILLTALFSLLLRNVPADAVDDYVQSAIAAEQLPGVAVAINQGGKTVKAAGYGLANIELSVAVTAQTVFQIQSVTKQFTAAAIMMLAEEGKVSVDAKVSTYLDGTPERWKEITIRHLLTHTSGIKDFINEPTASLRLEATEEEVFRETSSRPLNFPPGQSYQYSNSNYHLLAMIIRKLTGMAYGDFLRLRVFAPLGMGHTRVVSWSEIIPNRAAGYNLDQRQLQNGQFIAESILSYGGGGILSTAEDMARWDLALRNQTLLKQASLDLMWSPTKLNDGTWSAYGFGWAIGGRAPHRYVEHSGANTTGFTSHMVRFRDDDLTVVVLINAGFADPGKLAHRIASSYLPAPKPLVRKPIEDNEPIVNKLLKRAEEMIRDGRLEEGLFTPAESSALLPKLKETSEELHANGKLLGVELLQRSASGASRQYVYRLRFEKGIYQATLTLDPKDKIAGFQLAKE